MAAITRGVLFVHSATRAMCPHIEWAAGNVLGARATFDWTEQPAGRLGVQSTLRRRARPRKECP